MLVINITVPLLFFLKYKDNIWVTTWKSVTLPSTTDNVDFPVTEALPLADFSFTISVNDFFLQYREFLLHYTSKLLLM